MACLIESRANDTLSGDSVYRFRFVRDKGMFYVPYKGNSEELARLLVLIRQHREDILAGNLPVFVKGFCSTPNRAIARERSNRVKSEMILRAGLREECFRTANATAVPPAAQGDYVEVRLTLPAVSAPPASADLQPASTDLQPASADLQPEDSEYKDLQSASDTTHYASDYQSGTGKTSDYTSGETGTAGETGTSNGTAGISADCKPAFSLRANLLRWATLTPDLGIEYRLAHARIGLLVNGTYADWGWKGKQRRYKIWRLSPEVRYYLGAHRRGFLGAMYHRGEFHYKLGDTGKAGDYQGGGLTGGYRLPLGRHFALDLHAAAGYTRAEYDKYTRIGNFNVRQNKDGKLVKDYWGINQLGVSLLYAF